MSNAVEKEFKNTPTIVVNSNGSLKIHGVSMSENTVVSYGPVFEWFEEMKVSKHKELNIELFFEYLNTSSEIVIIELLKKLKKLELEKNIKSNILWRYEEDDSSIYELGLDLEIASDTKFEFEEIVD